MKPLIDADILCYEIGFAAEAGWKSAGFPSFDYVADLLDNRIKNICAVVEATEPPTLYLTGKTNFRFDIAKTKPYKARPSLKPFHYYNIKAYIQCDYDSIISEGMEADDLMAIEQTIRGSETIICSRDKDLRQVPGWTYSWELGNQPQFGPLYVEQFGSLQLSSDRKKLSGTGLKFFYAQCLLGDPVDTVPGLNGMGPVKVFALLNETKTEQEAYERVREEYQRVYEELTDEILLEQGRLLWMTRKLHPDGKPVLWELPVGGNQDKE